MKINRNNYQLWVTDYYDGLLDGSHQAELFLFLRENPDLNEEFELYGYPSLHPDIFLRINKEPLKKDFHDLSADQQEEYIVALIEGDLPAEEAETLSRLVSEDKEAADIFTGLKRIRLEAPPVQFPAKASLKRIPLRSAVRRIAVNGLSAAAAIAIAISLWIVLNNNKPLSIPGHDSAELLPVHNREAAEQQVTASAIQEEPEPAQRPAILKTNTEKRIEPQFASVSASSNVNTVIAQPREKIKIQLATVADKIVIMDTNNSYLLADMKYADIITEQENPGAGEFIARNFRKLILREAQPEPGNLKAYEVADATVNGMNRLLGWEMKLEKEKDASGKLNSFRFTSQLISVDHKKKSVAVD